MKSFGKIVYCFLLVTQAVWAISDGSLAKVFHAADTVIAGQSSTAKAMAVQADGKAVVAGYSTIDGHNRFAVARFNVDGSLDETFGNGGLVTTKFGAGEKISGAHAIVIQPDGKILAGGFTNVIRDTFRWCLARYNVDGSLDESFFGDRGIIPGTVITAFYKDEKASQINGMALQSDGKIVAAGFVAVRDSVFVALGRYSQDGSLDSSFNESGVDSIPGTLCMSLGKGALQDDRANAIAIQPDGKIVIAGSSYALGYKTCALARYMPDGKLDNSLYDVAHSRVHGVVLTVFGSGERECGANALVIQPDGKIVVGGYSDSNNFARKSRFALARYDQCGLLDQSFGGNGLATIPGTVITSFGSQENGGHVNALVLQADGKIVAGGSTMLNDKSMFAIARYDDNGALDSSFSDSNDTVVGTVRTKFNNSVEDEIFGMGIHQDGTIIAAGRTLANIRPAFALARYACRGGQLQSPMIICPDDSSRFINGSAILLKGMAQNKAFVHILVDGNYVGGTVSNAINGEWSYTLPALKSGYRQIMAVETYKNGNVNVQSAPIVLHIDQHPQLKNQVWQTVGLDPIYSYLQAQGASGNYRVKVLSCEHGDVIVYADNSFVFKPLIPYGKGKMVVEVTDEVTNCSTISTMEIIIHRRPESDGVHFETGYATTLNADLKNTTIIGEPPFEFNLIGIEGGQIELNKNGSFLFTPADQFKGEARMQYTITDSHKGISDPITATITVHQTPCCAPENLWTLKGKPFEGSLVPLIAQDRSPYHFELAGPVENGDIKINQDGSCLLMPPSNFVGIVKVPMSIVDSQQSKMTGTLEIIVKEEPKVSDLSFTIGQGDIIAGSLRESLSGGIAPYTFEIDQNNKNALILINDDGTFICTPQQDFLGEFSFKYGVKDVHGTKSNSGTCFITVNEKPRASKVVQGVAQGEKLCGSLQKLVSGGNPPYTFKKIDDIENGSLTINSDGSYEFVPHDDFVGETEFKYLVIDAKGTKSVAGRVAVTVNEKPRIISCEQEIAQGNALTGSLTPLVTGGYPPYIFQKVGEPKVGTLTIDPCGTYQFVPGQDFVGDTKFTYEVTDIKKSLSKTGHVSITVNERPRAHNVAFEVCQGQEVSGSLQDLVDGGNPPYIFEKVNDARENPVVILEDGSYYCKPHFDFIGRIKCNYVAIDSKGSISKWGTLFITVNEKPRARNAKLTISQGEQLTGSLKAFIQGGQPPYYFQKVDDSVDGSLTINPDGSYQFIPRADFIGTTQAKYVVVDARKTQSFKATIWITVNEKPQANSIEHEILQGDALMGSLTPFVMGGNPPYIFEKAEEPKEGSLIMSPCGFYQFIPAAHFAGKTKFNYNITDIAKSISKNAQVNVTVHERPQIKNLELNIGKGQQLSGSLQKLAAGGCPPYTFMKVNDSKEYPFIIHEDGSYQCMPDSDFVGTAECSYMVIDAKKSKSMQGSITITVYECPRVKDIKLEVVQGKDLAGSLAMFVTGGNPPYAFEKKGDGKDGFFISADGSYRFSCNPSFVGTITCRYVAIDAKKHKSAEGEICITVNEKPSLINFEQEIAQGQALVGSLTPLVMGGNPPYIFQKTDEPKDGNLIINPCGTYQFVPAQNFAGKTTFNCNVTDIKNSVSKASQVTVVVHEKPRVSSEKVEMMRGQELSGSLVALVDGGHKPYIFEKAGDPENGSLVINPDGTYHFIPNPEFTGKAFCRYAVIDAKKAKSLEGVLEITVHEKLHTIPAQLIVAQGEKLSGSLNKLIQAGQQPFTFQKIGDPENGSLEIKTDGSYEFTPHEDFVGTTEFKYSAVDAKKIMSAEGAVAITVLEKPRLMILEQEISQGNALVGSLTPFVMGGYPPYNFQKVGEPKNGTLTIDPCGSYQFVPADNFVGMAHFDYQVTDMKKLTSKIGEVSVAVIERPCANNVNYEVCQGQEVSGSLQDMVDGGTPPYVFEKVNDARENPVVINEDGSYHCKSSSNFAGRIKCNYVAIDSKGSRSKRGTIFITVNEKPRAHDKEVSISQGEQLTGSLKGLIKGGQPPYTFQKISDCGEGSLTINPDGSYQFSPHKDFVGTTIAKYIAIDARKLKSAEGALVITVHEKPHVMNGEQEISQGQMLVGSLTPSVLGGYPPYSFQKMGEPKDGTLFMNPCGTYQFMPATNFVGKTAFNYNVTDMKKSVSKTGQVQVTVHGRPQVSDTQLKVPKGSEVIGSLLEMITGGNPPYTFEKVGNSVNGSKISISQDGIYHFGPDMQFVGEAAINYVAIDAKKAQSLPGKLSISVDVK